MEGLLTLSDPFFSFDGQFLVFLSPGMAHKACDF